MNEATLRIVFMGTPYSAVPSLRALRNLPRDTALRSLVVAVVTQPDRPAGRGKRLSASPVKIEAGEAGLPILQPENLRGARGLPCCESTAPDLIVVAAYAQILSRKIPQLASLRLHQCARLAVAVVPRRVADQRGHSGRPRGNRRDHYANGGRVGHRADE